MAAEPSTGMQKPEMKRLLARSKQEPVNCAVAESGKTVLLLMDKLKQPRALLQSLEKEFGSVTNPRFGTAQVDEEIDPKLARFRLNRPASGLARKLVRTLKGTGFTKVEIMLDDGSVADSAGDEDETEQQGPPAPASGEAAAPAHDAAHLTQALAALAGRIKGVGDPAKRAELVKLAVDAQSMLKAGDLSGAETALRSLNQAEAGMANGAKPQVRSIWLSAKEEVDGRLARLGEELRSYDDPDLNQVAEFGLFGLTGGRQTVELMAALLEFEGADDAGRAEKESRLKKAVGAYRSMLAASPIAKALDDNPFEVEVGLQKTLGRALETIEQHLA